MLQDIVPKAQYGITVGRCKYIWGSGGTVSPPASPGQHLGVGPGAKHLEALKILHCTVPKIDALLPGYCSRNYKN